MSDKLLNVEYIEIQPEYVYMMIPAEYICIYHKLLTLMADYGIEMLDDCKSDCKDKNRNIITCFNMFNAAVASRKLNQLNVANTLIKYIEGQLNILYNGVAPVCDVLWPVDEKGKLYAAVGCTDPVKFYIKVEDGKLYEELNTDKENEYHLGENDIANK